jgi:hypothetical protein
MKMTENNIRPSLIIPSFICFLLIFVGCNKYNEEVPFFDNLFLEYDTSPGHYKLIYKVNILSDSNYKILKTHTGYKTDAGKTEIYVNKYGKGYKSSESRYEGVFSPIWIPVHEVEIGDTLNEIKVVDRKDKWEKWEVLVVKDTRFTLAEDYYDLNTGYMVGGFARTPRGAGKLVLAKTNADIPTIEE